MKKRSLLIDGHYMVKRLVPVLGINFSEMTYEADKSKFIKHIIDHFCSELRKQQNIIERVVVTMDRKSWRKDVKILTQDKNVVLDYKANRSHESDIDWLKAYEIFQDIVRKFVEKYNFAFTWVEGAEGDDAIWAWSKRLAFDKEYSIVYCTDTDLNQLVTPFTAISRQVRSSNMPEGQMVLQKNEFKALKEFSEKADIFTTNLEAEAYVKQYLGNKSFDDKQIVTVNPYEIIFYQCIEGSFKDNIPPIWSWKQGGKTDRNSYIKPKHIWEAISKIPGYETFSCFDSMDEALLYDESWIKEFIKQLRISTKQAKEEDDLEHFYNVFVSNRKLAYLSEKEIPKEVQMRLFENIQSHLQTKTDISSFCEGSSKVMGDLNIVLANSYFATVTSTTSTDTMQEKQIDDLFNNLMNL